MPSLDDECKGGESKGGESKGGESKGGEGLGQTGAEQKASTKNELVAEDFDIGTTIGAKGFS